jgi:integrase
MPNVLTARALQAIKPANSRKEIPDAYLRGLYFIVQPSGMKSWAVRYRHGKRTRKLTIGVYPAIDLKTARELAAKALRSVAEGRDPGQEKTQVRNAKLDTIDGAIAQFIERHCKQSNRPRTVKSTELLLRLHVLPRWRGRPVNSVTRRDVLDMVDRVIDAGTPVAANRALTATKTFFNWCIGRDIISVSPCAGVKPPTAERARDRILTDNELCLVWHAAEEIGWPFGPLVQMLIVTGQRRDEVAKMQWSEIDLKERLWTLPRERAKNDRPHSVPLSPLAISILKSVPRITGAFVFTTNGKTPSSGYSHARRRFDARLPQEMPAWRWHDLRRTLASGMARLGINLPTIEKVLNHVSGSFGGIVSVYQHHDFADEKRKALEAWSAHVEKLISGKPADKVVSIRGER